MARHGWGALRLKTDRAPWRDSSKNLVRDVVGSMSRHRPSVMARQGSEGLRVSGVRNLSVYGRGKGAFAPALLDNVRVLDHLIRRSDADIWHFFFAPNKKSAMAAKLAKALRSVATVQTVCSAPADGVDPNDVLFADITVVLSDFTRERFEQAGVDGHKLRTIRPCIAPLEPLSEYVRQQTRKRHKVPSAVPLLLYPGDLEFGAGARITIDALSRLSHSDAQLVMASRPKTVAAEGAQVELQRHADELGLGERVLWVGEVPDIHELLGSADVVVLPTDTLYAKMDYPLVLLEAMSMARAVVVSKGTPAQELAGRGGAVLAETATDSVAEKIDCLLGSETERQALGKRARHWVARECDPLRVARPTKHFMMS